MPRKLRSSTEAVRKQAATPVVIRPHVPFFAKPPILAAILLTMAVSAVYLWFMQPMADTEYAQNHANNSENSAQNTAPQPPESAVERVSQMVVTLDEEPQLYTVTDLTAFQEQNPAVSGVELGDKVVMWSDKTVVYSPHRDKIVAIYPTPAPVPPSPEIDATIEVRNGSGVAGAAGRLKKTLQDAGLSVKRVGDAAGRYTGTVVVDLSSGVMPAAFAETLKQTGGAAGELPEGEPASDASILVIIGL
jgi:hypothetical protein